MQAPKGTKVIQTGGGGLQVNPALPPRGGGGPGRPGVGGAAAQALPAAMQLKQNPAFQSHAAQQRGAQVLRLLALPVQKYKY
jgi:hypothetical protein